MVRDSTVLRLLLKTLEQKSGHTVPGGQCSNPFPIMWQQMWDIPCEQASYDVQQFGKMLGFMIGWDNHDKIVFIFEFDRDPSISC